MKWMAFLKATLAASIMLASLMAMAGCRSDHDDHGGGWGQHDDHHDDHH